MKKELSKLYICLTFLLGCTLTGYAQQGASVYGDQVKADVKMNYVYSLEEALKQAHEQDKPIFFNCFADWAIPCHTMNKEVFSNQAFCDYMNKNFINLFMEMTGKDAAPIAQKYGIKGFAQYLVLDKRGNILLRIMGGKTLPEFQECVMLALSPATSLAGTEATYKSGKYGKKELLNYTKALRLAGEHDRFREIAKEYYPLLKEKEYTKPENWDVFTSFITDRTAEQYKYLVANKPAFEKKNGSKRVNMFIETCFFPEVYQYASGKQEYDGVKMLDIYNEMLNVGLPDSCFTFTIYQIAKLRGERKFTELYRYMNEHSDELKRTIKFELDSSFEFSDLSDEQKLELADYLNASAAKLPGHLKEQLEGMAKQVVAKPEHGIAFELLKFDEALAKAKETGKLVFMDCYTTWCGPCKMMDRQIFPLPEVGELFNKHFINLKKDMEKGEGIELARRFDIKVFPIMLILDGDGKEIHRIVGGRYKDALIKEVTEVLEKNGR